MTNFCLRWRSILYVPAKSERYVKSALTSGADAVILDLEDSVPLPEKAAARDALPAATRSLTGAGIDVLVRVNQPLEMTVPDIQAAAIEGVAGLVLPKVYGASHLRLVHDLLDSLEAARDLRAGTVKLLPIIETCAAWLDMARIFSASSRIVGAMLGGEDFALACAAEPTDDFLLMPKQQFALAAHACGVVPIGLLGTLASFSDEGRFMEMARRSARFGFGASTCIHPKQVPLINRAFTPSDEQVEHARRVVAAYAAAVSEGKGAVQLDGAMVDAPVAARAQKLLSRKR